MASRPGRGNAKKIQKATSMETLRRYTSSKDGLILRKFPGKKKKKKNKPPRLEFKKKLPVVDGVVQWWEGYS